MLARYWLHCLPGVGFASTCDLRARDPRLTPYCRCRGRTPPLTVALLSGASGNRVARKWKLLPLKTSVAESDALRKAAPTLPSASFRSAWKTLPPPHTLAFPTASALLPPPASQPVHNTMETPDSRPIPASDRPFVFPFSI